MIAARFAEQARLDGSRLALRTGQRDWTYAELQNAANTFQAELSEEDAGKSLGIIGSDFARRLVGLLAADLFKLTPCIFPADMGRVEIHTWSERLGLEKLFDASTPLANSLSDLPIPTTAELPAKSQSPSLWLFTSGTTGPPKPVEHTWKNLTVQVHTGQRHQNRSWFLAYDPHSFAGLQVVLQALLTGGTLSDVSQATPEEAARRLVEEKIEFASGTPTFWRMLLGAANATTWHQAAIGQITLGGEAVSEGTLAALKAAFPQARISHIYATSELGVCFSVSDGHAGFPASYLQTPPAGCQLRISEEGELEVLTVRRATAFDSQAKPADASAANKNDWQATGDLVELREDRVYFVGRKSGVIHVGGGKVVPEEVEAVIRNVPGVAEVCVSGQPSSVLGAIVRADVVAAPETESAAVRTAILAACQAQLPRHKVPAMIEFHTTLPRTATGKLARCVSSTESQGPN